MRLVLEFWVTERAEGGSSSLLRAAPDPTNQHPRCAVALPRLLSASSSSTTASAVPRLGWPQAAGGWTPDGSHELHLKGLGRILSSTTGKA